MQLVSAEGTSFFYFGKADPWDRDQLPLEVLSPDAEAVERIRSESVRLALFASMLTPGRGNVYFLSWPGDLGIDLVELDGRVRRGTYVGADFAPAVRTVHQETFCDGCQRAWSTLVIPPADPYPDAPRLLSRKMAKAKRERCPACEAPFRQLVVEIFGPARLPR